MQDAGGVILVGIVVLAFAGVIFWAAVIQPRQEEHQSAGSLAESWKACGLAPLPAGEFSLYQIFPTDRWAKAEFVVENEDHQEVGRYTGNDPMSGTLTYSGKSADLYIQSAPLGGSVYAGKVGGTSDDSIVIRDGTRLIAEAWRESAAPTMQYRFVYSTDTFNIANGARPTHAGTITRNGERLSIFRCPKQGSRNILVAFHRDLPEELKMCFSAILLLR